MNDVSQALHRHFAGPNGVWIVEKGKQAEAAMFQIAIAEIDRLHAELTDAEAAIAEGLETKKAELDAATQQWVEALSVNTLSIRTIRNAAKSLVTQIDKAQKED
jgi:hypothetical protein